LALHDSKDWLPWRNAPNLSSKERVGLNNDEFWRLITKAPVGRVIQVAATLTIANYARSLALSTDHQRYAQLDALTVIGICVCLAAFAQLMIQASSFNHDLKSADRHLHPPNWWRWHCFLHHSGRIAAGVFLAGASGFGLLTAKSLF
jgi:hypothetical protein